MILFTIREKFKNQATNKYSFNELEEREFEKMPTLGDKIQVGKKYYRVDNIIIASHMKDEKGNENDESFLDVVLVDKHYEDNIKRIKRVDRFKHEIIDKKDGGYYTIDKNGKKVREWDKNDKLIYGEPYPKKNNAGDGI
jgi:hypothetical protein